MKTNKFTLLIIGFILVTIGGLLKILKVDYTEYFLWPGLLIELIGIIQLISRSKKSKES